MNLGRLTEKLPNWKSVGLAIVSGILLVLAFPDFEFWWLGWVALVPLLWAIERERESTARGFVLGWLFGTIFFFGTCWWLTFAPITYASFPPALAYFLMLIVSIAAGIFPAIFGGVMASLLQRFGSIALLAAPFVWVFSEFLRYWLTGNNWNALGYSQAFSGTFALASYGGVYLAALPILAFNALACVLLLGVPRRRVETEFSKTFQAFSVFVSGRQDEQNSNEFLSGRPVSPKIIVYFHLIAVGCVLIFYSLFWISSEMPLPVGSSGPPSGTVVAVQPNVPMSGLTEEKWHELRQRHIQLAESAINSIATNPRSEIRDPQLTVIFPESPMNFMYETDAESKAFIDSFAAKHNVNVLFNSAEPDAVTGKFFNSAVMVGPESREIQQYDKIYLVPFGEAVPFPLEGILPGFVGNFAYGAEHSLFPLGDAKAGAMICFESHFGQLSRQYVLNGADVLIEMTNDGYLGPTPVLRQHLANAVFRAVETNRPLLRVTNVGISAYITERGEVKDAAPVYQEDTRIWTVSKSDGSQTFYVKYGDWFAWLCSIISIGLLIFGFIIKSRPSHDTDR